MVWEQLWKVVVRHCQAIVKDAVEREFWKSIAPRVKGTIMRTKKTSIMRKGLYSLLNRSWLEEKFALSFDYSDAGKIDISHSNSLRPNLSLLPLSGRRKNNGVTRTGAKEDGKQE